MFQDKEEYEEALKQERSNLKYAVGRERYRVLRAIVKILTFGLVQFGGGDENDT